MSQRPQTSFRNSRKHFLKCVDCGCQTLPQNACKERPWSAAASLYVSGRLNDGPLCFTCANKRRALLGLPLEQDNEALNSEGGLPVIAVLGNLTRKSVRINDREYDCKSSNLESLIEEWKHDCFYDECRELDSRWWRVFVNHKCIAAEHFASVPISDADEVSIVMGRGRVVGRKRHA